MTEPRVRTPAPLPGHARAMLMAHRDAHEIPAEVKERIWSVVGADDAPEPAFDPLDDHDHEAPRVGRRTLGYAGAALAAAAVLLVAWRMGGTLAERREAERSPGAAVMQDGGSPSQGRAVAPPPRTAPSRRHESAPPEQPADDAAGPDEAPTPDSTPSADPPTRSRPSSSTPVAPPSPPPEGQPPPSPSSDFAAERELVASAWRALALGEHAQALEAAAEHARRFPSGLLVPERAAIETIARCRRSPAEGPQRASAFHRAHPRSPLAARVDEACEKKSPTP
ncbi:hypothetical protein [Paraliomyxa miuraensis]|uniref:hypothetical protein n=1 Tax=Paraliomyxa miuraensis TaxID=376150 RepID=UPI00225469D6|nr:hypothetical protein [Paraliomyxa miuraensis]MCX4240644.1 hypothetical protein [Paraliomyxa miuraensis]